MRMDTGKLPADFLDKLLKKNKIRDTRVVLGPKPGEDAALIDLGDRYLVAKTDPITFATDLIGWYVVQVNSNDLAVMGATPKWLLVTLLLPEGVEVDVVDNIFDQLIEACDALDISLIGGHTEITHDIDRPIAVGALLGEVDKEKAILTSDAKSGDSIILTKGIAVEGTALLARETPEALLAAGVSQGTVDQAADLLFNPGISVVTEARIMSSVADVHSMHDPTEGGLATGLRELAKTAGLGLIVDKRNIPVLDVCREICSALELDPMGLIASGSLLATVSSMDAPRVVSTLIREGIEACEIGSITPMRDGIKMRTPEGVRELPSFPRDEVARYFGR
ncbi:MAG: AIR synthase family protein [SAR202 cluster bacterium]|nr:AIR synthase family protein [SAR202 cluster bacterium]